MPPAKHNPSEDQYKEVRADLERVTRVVMGNGDTDHSLVIRTDRLENAKKSLDTLKAEVDLLRMDMDRLKQRAKKSDFYLNTVIIAVVGLVFEWIRTHLH